MKNFLLKYLSGALTMCFSSIKHCLRREIFIFGIAFFGCLFTWCVWKINVCNKLSNSGFFDRSRERGIRDVTGVSLKEQRNRESTTCAHPSLHPVLETFRTCALNPQICWHHAVHVNCFILFTTPLRCVGAIFVVAHNNIKTTNNAGRRNRKQFA